MIIRIKEMSQQYLIKDGRKSDITNQVTGYFIDAQGKKEFQQTVEVVGRHQAVAKVIADILHDHAEKDYPYVIHVVFDGKQQAGLMNNFYKTFSKKKARGRFCDLLYADIYRNNLWVDFSFDDGKSDEVTEFQKYFMTLDKERQDAILSGEEESLFYVINSEKEIV